VDLDFNELRKLVAALNDTDVAELTLKNAQFELTLRKFSALSAAMPGAEPSALVSAGPPPPVAKAAKSEAAPTVESSPLASPMVDANLLEITSPMVGTFYRAPAPDEPAFVNVGDRIQTGQTVCIIEAMKLMNELEAEVTGEIVEILVENAEPVEFGQPLMRVKPL
jgi:acetyl-CoA carboxylase biotin carboxyl carrier protein